MRKPVYKYPDFVSKVTLKNDEKKRYWLNVEIDKEKDESILVILKNPSRATKEISDKTVFNVCNYIHRNQSRFLELKNIGNVIFLNLITNYETYSDKLQVIKDEIIDKENLMTINDFCGKHKKVIIAWGNHPSGLYNEYQILKSSTMEILTKNESEVFFVDKMSNIGNPKHGQVWGYKNELIGLK
ncbi:DUF1643 domain-containing protein [Labilibaculum manganireducens]|uniref:DUF1643 domain-containing protein n=1 Tax=Labilibaculum manganireducens TaxID=1940525 RepID=UPI0029F526ED|nr:DUF1643 domain-containing protein [Labilibaculum manganireducens]